MGKVRWDSVADQILLAKILETHDLHVDAARVAEAWPADQDESKPTPRAIRERIFRIKELVKGSATTASGTISPATPRKRAAPRRVGAEEETPTKKRKPRVTKAQQDAADKIARLEAYVARPKRDDGKEAKYQVKIKSDDEEKKGLFETPQHISDDEESSHIDPRFFATSPTDEDWYPAEEPSDFC